GRANFRVEGLNDDRGTTSAEQQIDITLDDPHLPANRQVVRKSIFAYPNGGSQTVSTGLGNPVVQETAWQDNFDIAMDANYLYIVWRSGNDIYATVIELSTGNVP